MKTVSIYPTQTEKSQLFDLMDKYDSKDGFTNLTESLSNFIKGQVTTSNLRDMYFALDLIDENDSKVLRPILEDRIFEIA